MSEQASLAFNSIGFERDDIPLFAGVSGSLHPGDILQIEGPNGVGKTTLMKILATVLPASRGNLVWQGKDISRNTYDYLSELLFIGHTAGVTASLTPRENLRWWMDLNGIQCADLDANFAKIGLSGFADVPCYTLSAGQSRRVALTRLLLKPCKVWILDEPFTAIDKAGCEFLAELVVKRAQQGGVVILSSHQSVEIAGVHRLDLADYRQQVSE